MKRNSLFIFFATAAWAAVCFLKVHQAADPSGGDGYFYLKQTEWLADHHSFYHSDFSFIFFPLAFLYKLTGSSLLAFQIVTSLSLFLISSAIGLLFLENLKFIEKGGQKVLLVSVFTLALAMQGSVLKLSFEFAKSGLAQGLTLCGIAYYYLDRKKVAFVFLLLAALTHKIAAVFFVLSLVFSFYDWYLKNRQRINSKYLAIGFIAILGGCAVGISILFPRLLKHFVSFTEHFYFEKVFLIQVENLLLSRFLIGITFVWLIVGIFQCRKVKNKFFIILIFFSLLPFLPIYSGYNAEIKYRLLLISFTLSAAIFVVAWPTIQNQYLRRLLMMVTLTVLCFQSTQYTGFPWIMNWSEKIKNLDQLQERVTGSEELVTQHGLQFYIDYKTNIRARSMVSMDRMPFYQIAYTPEFYRLNSRLSDELRQIEIISLGSSYALFEYEEFQNLMKEYPMLSDWRNTFQIRPDFVQDY